MADIPRDFEVRLVRGLERYHASLRPGALGKTLPPHGRSALFRDRYLRVVFPEVEIDVLLNDLEVTDPRWKALAVEEASERAIALAGHVKRATVYTGPKGGFRELVVEYDHGRPNDRWSRVGEAKPVLADLEARGLLEEQRQKRGVT